MTWVPRHIARDGAWERLVRVGLTLAVAAAFAQAPAQAQNAGVLHAQFKLERGYFVIDETASTFDDPEKKFRSFPNAKAAIIEAINRSLRGDVEAIFYNLETSQIGTLRRSRHIDTEDGETDIDARRLQAVELVRKADSDLIEISAFWPDVPTSRHQHLVDIFARFLSEERGVCWINRNTSVLYREPPDQIDEPDAAAIWQDKLEYGRFDFTIADPIDAEEVGSIAIEASDSERAAFARAGITRHAIMRLTSALVGNLWSRPLIERQISDYLFQAGISSAHVRRKPSSGCTFAGGERTVEISGAPARLRRIVIKQAKADRATAEELLSRVLPYRDFQYFRTHPDMLVSDTRTTVSGGSEADWVFDLASREGRLLPESGRYGFLVTDRKFDDLRARIGILGHQASSLLSDATSPQADGLDPVPQADGVTLSDGDVDSWLELKVEPLAASDDQTVAASGAGATPVPPDPPATAPAIPAAQPAKETPFTSRRPNHLRVTAGNEPGKPFFASVEYARDALTGSDDGLALTVGTRGKPTFKGSYERDFVAFDALGGRRLSLTISGESDYLAGHVIGTSTVDERRSGGGVAAQLELFRDWNHHWLNLDASFTYDSLDQRDVSTLTTSHGWLWKGRVGLGYRWLGDLDPYFPRLEINPTIDVGRSNDSGAYFKPAMDARFHRYLPAFFEFDSHLAATWASELTPGTELPRFGGSDSVRGFKDEVAAARYSWALQNEVYVPIRFLNRIAPGIDDLVRRNLKLSVFVDIGGAGRNSQGIAGFEAGAGVGLRLNLKDQFVIRLDWAHPLSGFEKNQGGGAVYFSIAILPQHF